MCRALRLCPRSTTNVRSCIVSVLGTVLQHASEDLDGSSRLAAERAEVDRALLQRVKLECTAQLLLRVQDKASLVRWASRGAPEEEGGAMCADGAKGAGWEEHQGQDTGPSRTGEPPGCHGAVCSD